MDRYASLVPREVLCQLQYVPRCVLSSDGDGSDAVVDVSIWGGFLEVPRAAFLQAPREIRLPLFKQRRTVLNTLRDMFEVGAVGPLMVLATCSEAVQGC